MVLCLLDSWIGCDKTLPMKLKVNELTRAEREGRTQRGKPVVEKAEPGAIENGEAAADDAGSEDEDSEEDGELDQPAPRWLRSALSHLANMPDFALHLTHLPC